jgi:hypothetical protein
MEKATGILAFLRRKRSRPDEAEPTFSAATAGDDVVVQERVEPALGARDGLADSPQCADASEWMSRLPPPSRV